MSPQPTTLTDYKHSVWRLTPEQITGTEKRLHGYHLRQREQLTTRLSQDHRIGTQPLTILRQAGQYARDSTSGTSVSGKCLTITGRTVKRLQRHYGIPATTQRFWVSDGSHVQPHYAAVASVPDPDTLDWFPYEDRWCRFVSDQPCLNTLIVDPSLTQFTDTFSFSLHPQVDREISVEPVELVHQDSPLAPVYRPQTINHCPQLLWR